jgi:RHS repeat-associated protein
MKMLAGAVSVMLLVGGTFAHWRAAKRDENLITRNTSNPVKNVPNVSQRDLADIPPEALHPQPPKMASEYNANSGGLPPGALPPGVTLPGIPMMQGGRTTAQGYGVYDGLRQQFTGYERDNETGLDFAQARYYSSAQGRFTSIDPENAGANPIDPQSWNGYAYARNNPLKYTDPDGREYRVCDNTGKCWTHWDPQWKPVLKDTKGANDAGVSFQGNMKSGVILDAEGNQLGTYQWVGEDYWSNATNALMYGELPRRTAPIPRAVAAFGVASVAGGVTGGLGLYGLSSGSALTTLGTLGRVAPAAASGGTAVLNQLSRTDRSIFQQAAQYGLSASNSFLNNLNALTQAVVNKIPGGEVTKIGQIGNSPVYGSLRSGVGIAEVEGQTVIVKIAQGTPQILGPVPK